jgi:hypothetical protein
LQAIIMDALKLVALDKDDVEVISTHLQDAVLKVGDIIWHPAEKRLVLALNRFDWEDANGAKGEFRRRRAALRFDRVLCVKCRHLSPTDKNAVLNLLAVEFEESDPPGGTVTLFFSGGGVLRAQIECLECELADLGPAWVTSSCPQHLKDAS